MKYGTIPSQIPAPWPSLYKQALMKIRLGVPTFWFLFVYSISFTCWPEPKYAFSDTLGALTHSKAPLPAM